MELSDAGVAAGDRGGVTDVGPYGPYFQLGRRGPLWALAVLVVLAGGAAAVVMTLTGSSCPVERFGPGSGDGRSEARALLVHDPAALAVVDRCPDRTFRQVADLIAPNPWTPVGLGSGGFTGTYDGDDHRITGLRVFLPGSGDVGMFAVLDGSVRDLVLEDVAVEGGGRAGAVAGRATAAADVRGVTVTGARVTGGPDTGGLVGLAHPDAAVAGGFRGSVMGDGTASDDGPTVGRIGTSLEPDAPTP